MATDIADTPVCEECGYNLTGLIGNICPECGQEFDPQAVRMSCVPWERRKRLGLVSAFLLTIWRVIARPKSFRQEATLGGPLSHKSGRSFRNLTASLVGGSAGAVVAAGILIRNDHRVTTPMVIICALLTTGMTAVAAIGAIECLAANVLRPVEEYDHPCAAGVLLYAGAPLAFSPLVAMALILALWRAREQHTFVVERWAWCAIVALILVWWFISFRLAWAILDRSGWRFFSLAIVLPIAWMMVGVCWLIGMSGVGISFLLSLHR